MYDGGSCAYSADMAQTADGKLWVVFRSYENNYDIRYVTSVNNGASWSTHVQLTTDPDNDYDPSITQDSSGRIWITWESYRTGNPDIFYKTRLC